MSNYTAIAGVGDTLVGVLWSEVQRDADAQLKR